AVDAFGRVVPAAKASQAADWSVRGSQSSGFTLRNQKSDESLALGLGSRLVTSSDPDRFLFKATTGCRQYPEIQVNAAGAPRKGSAPNGEVSGLVDAHMHHMAFEFLGGRAHCGRPWHKYGVEYALKDCLDHTASDGCGAVLENVLFGNPARCHDTVGWPTFKDWPHPNSLTHESSYYKWVERAWRGGLRIFVNLLVENKALCDLYPLKKNSCNEMDSVRLQDRDLKKLQDYIDAQYGGPGKGWMRLVNDPYEARRVINKGKLAVVQGIEISQLFDCNIYNGEPLCSKAMIDEQLEQVYKMGVRQMEIVNKFDNALGGVAGDGGEVGVVTNQGNKKETGRYWDMKTCQIGQGDKEQIGAPRDVLIGNGLNALLPPGSVPVYGDPPHCNTYGLSDLGEYVVRKMMKRGMVIDPDHLSQAARDEVLALIEADDYPGVMSSHSWSNLQDYPRILAQGGVVTPMGNSVTGFVESWENIRPSFDKRYYPGFGYGADMNGFANQAGPRNTDHPRVEYPFESLDKGVTIEQQVSGERKYHINDDGMAHYGLFPDWVEDLRMVAGDAIVEDLARGAESYLQMWERAEGLQPAHTCGPGGGPMTKRGVRNARLGQTARRLLKARDRQPLTRGRVWRYCVREPAEGRRPRVFAVFNKRGRLALIVSTARTHRARGVGATEPAKRIRGAKPFGKGIRVGRLKNRSRFVYGVKRGRTRYVGVASRKVGRKRGSLRRYLRLAGVR
ncbi:MAG TPA: hypothetical protein VD790_05480, partial [Thermoleophilaceae bacterium]|nr:hypothetical protein [Thermoleophilaceae bacterium]